MATVVCFGTDASAASIVGVVFVDANGNGVRDAGEMGRGGVAVSNGREVVTTEPNGRYLLQQSATGFVSVTCPANASCPVSFHRGGGDFALVPADAADDFFFIQMSDVHAYANVTDMAGLLAPIPWYVPRVVAGWFVLNGIGKAYPNRKSWEIVAALREVVAPYRDVEDAWDSTVMMDYMEVSGDPANGIIVPAEAIPAALAEIAALRPSFVINTGDLILEGNRGDADSVERWFQYYGEVAAASGLDIYETIGNNELGGTDNPDFTPDDPRYGKALFRRFYGPTHYSFDKGPFHFAAVDTHIEKTDEEGKESWEFNEMEPAVRAWLDADLAAAKGRTLVVLNHEPFHTDPCWQFEEPDDHAKDDGLFAKYGVAYSLAGHIHRNGFDDEEGGTGVTHITTGALSGFRWSLPTTFDRRGYRLFYARDGQLYSAWKDTGEPLLGFVDPRGDASIHPGSKGAADPTALAGTIRVVAVAADVAGPFTKVELLLDGSPLATERWGDYFVSATFDSEQLASSRSALTLRATDAEDAASEVELRVSSAP